MSAAWFFGRKDTLLKLGPITINRSPYKRRDYRFYLFINCYQLCFTCELDAPTLLGGSRGKEKYSDIGIQQVDGLYAFCMGGWHKTTVVSVCGVDALKSYVRYFLFEKYKNF